MGVVLLQNLHMHAESLSYVDAMHAVLTHQGWFDMPKPMLAGMSVSGFRFTVDRRLTAESLTAYNWIAENFLACDFIGVTASSRAGFAFQPTFPLQRRRAITDIIASVDRGVGAIFWHNGFVVMTGYDADRELLYYSDGSDSVEGYKTLPYDKFGRNGTPYWYYQTLDDRIPMDPLAVFKESFVQAIFKWETHDIMLSKNEYGCGQAAYEMIISALEDSEYDADGARSLFTSYAATKRDIAIYMETVGSVWPEACEAAEQYRVLAGLFKRVITAGVKGAERVEMFREAKRVEERAIHVLKKLVRETAANRRHDVGLR
ncbi:hypothetical protein HQN90_36890 [Paenibacillus alba]|uniref:hypothetical protein n=1 Tax=Paenibacillus alba TaxID=1197127 RepID=UPI001564B5FD|nr:hypothetical protein [Paenibacillus alba]NQX71670.1 hypothetical protein [Paenibacillus alba]